MTEWDRLNDKVGSLYQQGDYAGAIVIEKKTHQMAEREFGPDHSNVAASLNNLAEIYRAQGQYALARPLLKRALVINETALGLDHLSVATSLRVWQRFMRKGKNMHGLNRAISVPWKLLRKLLALNTQL